MPKQVWLGGKYGSVIGNYAIVDDDDFERVSKYNWTVVKEGNNFYCYSGFFNKKMSIHRFLINPMVGLVVDHINHNGLDNRKENLRICTNQQNQFNRIKNNKNSHGFKGIRLQKNRYYSCIIKNGKKIYIGSFKTAIEAALSYDEKARELFGEFACLNFPDITIYPVKQEKIIKNFYFDKKRKKFTVIFRFNNKKKYFGEFKIKEDAEKRVEEVKKKLILN